MTFKHRDYIYFETKEDFDKWDEKHAAMEKPTAFPCVYELDLEECGERLFIKEDLEYFIRTVAVEYATSKDVMNRLIETGIFTVTSCVSK